MHVYCLQRSIASHRVTSSLTSVTVCACCALKIALSGETMTKPFCNHSQNIWLVKQQSIPYFHCNEDSKLITPALTTKHQNTKLNVFVKIELNKLNKKKKQHEVKGILYYTRLKYHMYSSKRSKGTFCKVCSNNDAGETMLLTTHAQQQSVSARLALYLKRTGDIFTVACFILLNTKGSFGVSVTLNRAAYGTSHFLFLILGLRQCMIHDHRHRTTS